MDPPGTSHHPYGFSVGAVPSVCSPAEQSHGLRERILCAEHRFLDAVIPRPQEKPERQWSGSTPERLGASCGVGAARHPAQNSKPGQGPTRTEEQPGDSTSRDKASRTPQGPACLFVEVLPLCEKMLGLSWRLPGSPGCAAGTGIRQTDAALLQTRNPGCGCPA